MDDTEMSKELRCTAWCHIHHLPCVTEHLGLSASELVADVTTPASVTESHSVFPMVLCPWFCAVTYQFGIVGLNGEVAYECLSYFVTQLSTFYKTIFTD